MSEGKSFHIHAPASSDKKGVTSNSSVQRRLRIKITSRRSRYVRHSRQSCTATPTRGHAPRKCQTCSGLLIFSRSYWKRCLKCRITFGRIRRTL